MKTRLRALVRSIRVWAFTLCFVAIMVALLPRSAAADGPCGCGNCLSPEGGCISLQGSICFHNSWYVCEYEWECATLHYHGVC